MLDYIGFKAYEEFYEWYYKEGEVLYLSALYNDVGNFCLTYPFNKRLIFEDKNDCQLPSVRLYLKAKLRNKDIYYIFVNMFNIRCSKHLKSFEFIPLLEHIKQTNEDNNFEKIFAPSPKLYALKVKQSIIKTNRIIELFEEANKKFPYTKLEYRNLINNHMFKGVAANFCRYEDRNGKLKIIEDMWFLYHYSNDISHHDFLIRKIIKELKKV